MSKGTLVKEGNVLTSWNTQGWLGCVLCDRSKSCFNGKHYALCSMGKNRIPQEPIMQIITATTLDVTTLIEHDIDEYWTAVMLFYKKGG